MKKALLLLFLIPLIAFGQSLDENAKTVVFVMPFNKKDCLKIVERSLFDLLFTIESVSSDQTLITTESRPFIVGGSISSPDFTAFIRLDEKDIQTTVYISGYGAADLVNTSKRDKVIACNSKGAAKIAWESVMTLAKNIYGRDTGFYYEILQVK